MKGSGEVQKVCLRMRSLHWPCKGGLGLQRLLELGRPCGGWGGGGGPRSKLLLSALFSLGPLSSAPILSLGGSEETQPVHPPVSGSLFGLNNSPDLFEQTLFSICSGPGIKGENKIREHLPHFSGVGTWH